VKSIGQIAHQLVTKAERERTQTRAAIRASPSLTHFVHDSLGKLLSVLPANVTEDELCEHALWEFEAASRRMSLCAKCPSGGGACDGDSSTHYKPGDRVEWRGTLEPTPCDRWQRYTRTKTLTERGIGEALAAATLDNYRTTQTDQANAVAVCRTYVGQWGAESVGLALEGPTNGGKSHLASAVCQALMDRHAVRFRFVYVPTLLDAIRDEYSLGRRTTAFEDAVGAPLLVLDDLGAERPTAFARERLEVLVHHRWMGRLPTIVTRNCSLEQLAERFGAPMVRRLSQMTTHLAEISGTIYG